MSVERKERRGLYQCTMYTKISVFFTPLKSFFNFENLWDRFPFKLVNFSINLTLTQLFLSENLESLSVPVLSLNYYRLGRWVDRREVEEKEDTTKKS